MNIISTGTLVFRKDISYDYLLNDIHICVEKITFTFGARLLKDEILHCAVNMVWLNKMYLPLLATAYNLYHQMMCSVLENKKENYHIKNKKATNFGIKRCFVKNEEETFKNTFCRKKVRYKRCILNLIDRTLD